MEPVEMEPAEMEADDQPVYCLICCSFNVRYKYNNNNKVEQPRYMCLDCKTMFTWGDHNRPKPQHYGKKRNQDPDKFRGLRRECSKCGTVNNARFKYYNNKLKYGETQPRFKCLSCGEQFQMHFQGGVLLSVKTSQASKPGGTPNTNRGNNARSTVVVPCNMTTAASAASVSDVGNYVDPVGPWSDYAVQQDAAYQSEVPESVEQVGRWYNYANDDEVLPEAEWVEVEESDGGPHSCTGEMVEASAVPWSSFYDVPNDHVAAACDYDVTGINAEDLGQFFIPDDEMVFAALFDPVEQSDVGKYSWAFEGDAVNVEQYFADTDADDQVEERDGGGSPSYTEELAAAAPVKFSVPDDREMCYLEDFEDDLDPSTIAREAECLWNLIEV